ncbi:MAG: DUF3137 domain-containing protein [Saprospiraceae bacterium]
MEEIVEYNSEDYFKGRTHDTAFEICELKVKTKSKVTGKIKIAFRGHFLKFNPNRNHEGKIWILPKTEKSNLTNSIKEMYRLGAKPIEDTVLSRRYLIYHTPEFILNHFLTDDLKKVLEDWANQNRTFFIYSEGPDIHVAIRNSMDILEPNIFTSNKRFDKILNLHQELSNMFEIIESFEKGV